MDDSYRERDRIGYGTDPFAFGTFNGTSLQSHNFNTPPRISSAILSVPQKQLSTVPHLDRISKKEPEVVKSQTETAEPEREKVRTDGEDSGKSVSL